PSAQELRDIGSPEAQMPSWRAKMCDSPAIHPVMDGLQVDLAQCCEVGRGQQLLSTYSGHRPNSTRKVCHADPVPLAPAVHTLHIGAIAPFEAPGRLTAPNPSLTFEASGRLTAPCARNPSWPPTMLLTVFKPSSHGRVRHPLSRDFWSKLS